jgi:hypothetical protein
VAAAGGAVPDRRHRRGEAFSDQEIRDPRGPALPGRQADRPAGPALRQRLESDAVTERHVRSLDNMVAHGINCLAVYVQGSNGGCPTFKSSTADTYPGMDVRIIQKDAAIPAKGFVVNVETQRLDPYDKKGIFDAAARKRMKATWKMYKGKPNAFLLFHSGYCQGVTGKSGTGPHPEMGGNGTGPDDRGIRFYYAWVKDNIGPYKYPKHARGRKSGARGWIRLGVGYRRPS